MANSPVPASQTYAVQHPAIINAPDETFSRDVAVSGSLKASKAVVLGVGTVAAAGTNQGTAATIPSTAPFISVTAADATKGVILPVSVVGTEIAIHNVANATLKVYPPSGGDINDGSQDAALSIAAKTQARFVNVDGTTWSAVYTAPVA